MSKIAVTIVVETDRVPGPFHHPDDAALRVAMIVKERVPWYFHHATWRFAEDDNDYERVIPILNPATNARSV